MSAASMADEGNFWYHQVYRTPMYPLFLALFLKLFGHTEAAGLAVVLVQRLLGLLSGLMLFTILRRTFSGRVALIGATLFLLSPLQLYYESVFLTEAQFIFLLFVFLWVTLLVVAKLRQGELAGGTFAALGVSAGALSLSRPIGQLLLVCVLVMFVLRFGVKRSTIAGSALALVLFLAAIFPWLKVNHDYYGFWGISRDIGINLFHRVVDVDYSPLPKPSNDPFVRQQVIKARAKTSTTYFHVYHALGISMVRNHVPPKELNKGLDDRMKAFAIETLLASPGRFIPNTFRNFGSLFVKSRRSVHFCEEGLGKPYLCAPQKGLVARLVPQEPAPPSERARALTHWYMASFLFPEAIVTVFFVLGVALSLRRGATVERVFLLFVVLYFTGLAALLNRPEDRFRLPVDGLIFGFGAVGVLSLVDLARRRATLLQESRSAVEGRAG